MVENFAFLLLDIDKKKQEIFLLDLKLNSTAYKIHIGLAQVADSSQQ